MAARAPILLGRHRAAAPPVGEEQAKIDKFSSAVVWKPLPKLLSTVLEHHAKREPEVQCDDFES